MVVHQTIMVDLDKISRQVILNKFCELPEINIRGKQCLFIVAPNNNVIAPYS
jgi:hypothetical protein